MILNYFVWDYRNEQIHGKGGKRDRAKNKELSSQIKHQFDLGGSELLGKDKNLFKGLYTLKQLLNKPIIDKSRWVHTVQLARDSAISEQQKQQQQ